MANHGPAYGLDAELEAKRSANYDQNLENDVRAFVEKITGESIGDDFHAGLKNGIILCKYVFLITLLPYAQYIHEFFSFIKPCQQIDPWIRH